MDSIECSKFQKLQFTKEYGTEINRYDMLHIYTQFERYNTRVVIHETTRRHYIIDTHMAMFINGSVMDNYIVTNGSLEERVAETIIRLMNYEDSVYLYHINEYLKC